MADAFGRFGRGRAPSPGEEPVAPAEEREILPAQYPEPLPPPPEPLSKVASEADKLAYNKEVAIYSRALQGYKQRVTVYWQQQAKIVKQKQRGEQRFAAQTQAVAQRMAISAGLTANAAYLFQLPSWKTSGGQDVIDLTSIGGQPTLYNNLLDFAETTPEGLTAIVNQDVRSIQLFNVAKNVQTMEGTAQPRSITDPALIGATAGGAALTPGFQAREAFERTPEFARQQFQATRPREQFQEFLTEQRPLVSERRFRFMESLFPQLERDFQATLKKSAERTFPGAKGTGFGFPTDFGEFIRKFEFEREFAGQTPSQRGVRGGFQPRIQQFGV